MLHSIPRRHYQPALLEPHWWQLDSWKVVHRHADPITAARPASLVIVDDRPG